MVGDLLSTGVGVVEQDDGSRSFGDALKGVDELSYSPCVLGLALPDCGMQGVDEEDGFSFVFDEEVLDLFLPGRSVDRVAAEAEVERCGWVDVGVTVEGGEDFAGGVVEAEKPGGGLFHRESAEGLSLGDCFGERDGDGGFADFGRSGKEDEAVLTEEPLVSVGSRVELEVPFFGLVEGVGDGGLSARLWLAGEVDGVGLSVLRFSWFAWVFVIVFVVEVCVNAEICEHLLIGNFRGWLSTR